MKFIFSIADVALEVDTGQLKLPADALKHGACRHFFSTVPGFFVDNGGCQAAVSLTADPCPGMGGLERIFDSQDSWSIFSDGDDLYIIDQYPPFTNPVWTARLHSGGMRITVYCGREIIDPRSQTLAFNPLGYPLDQILLMNYLATHEGGILHAAGWTFINSGWAFPGQSGAGKSTLAKLIANLHRGEIVSDDRIVVRKTGETFRMYGTPWPGEGGFAVNRGVQLKRLMFLSKGPENRITELPLSAAISRLLPVMSVPWYDRNKVLPMMDFCENLITRVPVYEFSFRPDASAVDFLTGIVHEYAQSTE